MAASAIFSPNNESVFFPPSNETIYVDENYSIKPPPYSTMNELMTSLVQNGPLVAVGRIGPKAYTEAPRESKDKVHELSAFYWKPNSFQESAPENPHLLIGVDKIKKYVYFTRAYDSTPSKDSLIRSFRPLPSDQKIYFMTYDKFVKRLHDLHPICPHAKWLFFTPADSLLDRGETEAKCKKIGQEIFDLYKTKERTGNREEAEKSALAKDALRRICDASSILGDGARSRARQIERAWDGVGDQNERWFG